MAAKRQSYEDAEREALRAEGASSLDTVDLTFQPGSERRHNLTAQRPKRLTTRNDRHGSDQRGEWLEQIGSLTALHREQRARRLEARSAELGRERYRAWTESGLVARGGADRLEPSAPQRSQWHDTRASGQRRLFEKVAACPDSKREVKGTCRAGCGHTFTLKVGCGSSMLCPECRADTARRIRLTFKRKRLGLLKIARKGGNTAELRLRRRGGRFVETYTSANPAAREVGGFSERFVTLTIPHEGTPQERVRVLRATRARFWRTLSDDIRPRLERRRARIFVEDSPNGFRAKWSHRQQKHVAPNELTLWDLVAYFYVLEWTAGSDGLGHPHIHFWLFGPWLDWRTIRAHWCRAYAHVRAEGAGEHVELWTPLLVTDVRKCSDDPSQELVKYLTKDWSDDDKTRVAPEVFAQVYCELDGKRRRQTSAGLGHWEVAKHAACPECGHECERRHWAFVEITSPCALERVWKPGELEPMPSPEPARVATQPTRAEELLAAYEKRRLEEWLASIDRRLLSARLAEAGIHEAAKS